MTANRGEVSPTDANAKSYGWGLVLVVDMTTEFPTAYIRTGGGRLVKCGDMPFPVKHNDLVEIIEFEDGTAGVGEPGCELLGEAEFIEDWPDHLRFVADTEKFGKESR